MLGAVGQQAGFSQIEVDFRVGIRYAYQHLWYIFVEIHDYVCSFFIVDAVEGFSVDEIVEDCNQLWPFLGEGLQEVVDPNFGLLHGLYI